MKTLFELNETIYSTRNNIVFVTVYDTRKRKDILTGCTIEHAVEIYGGQLVERAYPVDNQLIIEIKGN